MTETISQRELRNNSGEVLRRVQAGESYVVTNHGRPVARLVPLESEIGLKVAKPATRRFDIAWIDPVTLDISSEELLEDLRSDRL
jgi:prevent-host-death family protein